MTQEKITELAKAAKRQYDKDWRKSHPEQKAASNKRYWERRALKAIILDNERRAAGKEQGNKL